MQIWVIILIAAWLIGAIGSFSAFINKWNKPKWEKIGLSLAWPLILPLYLIHAIHNS